MARPVIQGDRKVAKHPKRRRKTLLRARALDAPLTSLADDQILSFQEWCALNRISERTGHRVIKGPNGPKTVQMSARRFGIRVADNRAWQHARERAHT
jgi:hypothetical protein